MLSETRIRSQKAGLKPIKIFDGLKQGLCLVVHPNGSKYWRVNYVFNGKRSQKALGIYPEVGLKEAREKAIDFKKNLHDGKLPVKVAGDTFREVAEEWAEKFFHTVTQQERERRRKFLDEVIFPQVGHMRVCDVPASVVLNQIIRPVEEKGTLEKVRRIMTTMSQIFRFAVATGRAERDVTRDLAGALKPRTVTHRATLIDPKEIGRLLKAIRHFSGSVSVGFALKLLPYVFVRPGEHRHAEWAEFDFDESTWRIPAGKMKMRTPHLVPLASQVKNLLEELRQITGSGRYLFPGAKSKDRPISDMAVNVALRSMGFGKDEICGHGFRGMASTLLNEKGYSPDWIERQLAHCERNDVRAAYNHAEYLPERRRMMQEWADWLDSLLV
ncbi:MAG: tyrosine-type recombinase/integrase [Deltaproteobacteria bacterium]|nr:tyrosine-type recombinase/integrase [Deltaproteobacteria bacterium]